ncbi:molybdopterin-binding protein [Paracoccaceae bacterium]|nr:molybdopterin-binding protein [Paracoccaceae bacterium]
MIAPPPLRDDCFALPVGVDWLSVERALELLRNAMHPQVATMHVDLGAARGRILAKDIMAPSNSPPHANSAIDGYGYLGVQSENREVIRLSLMQGRAAAGDPFETDVPDGCAVKVLTGAILPEGVDTVVLQEDVSVGVHEIAFRGPLKAGKNTRSAGEDIQIGQVLFRKGRKIRTSDLAVLASVGISQLKVYWPLRVGILSTGDELIEPGELARVGQIYDANRPMLIGQMVELGYDIVDLGRAEDDAETLRSILNSAAERCDALITTGGASAGDEDHMSALLRDSGSLEMWRIAVKPGRPMAMGLWNGLPVFGLPGNPVAAMVCALVFTQPALRTLAGGTWEMPQSYDVTAAFAKSKKPGRREYLRARIRNGRAEVFSSEGSGRVTGLSWAEGLVELAEPALDIKIGDKVRYIPFSEF